MTTNGDIPRRLVIDAGPFIALFNVQDRGHDEALRGFRELAALRARAIVPLPILFEVYKWLRYNVSGDAARRATHRIRQTTQVESLGADDLERTVRIVEAMPDWPGSLEDAVLARMAAAMRIPLWTMNYRDFGPLGNLRLWNPT